MTKKWATTVIGWDRRHPSRPAVDRFIGEVADEFRAGALNESIREVKVWLDEGEGFQLWETVPLRDTATVVRPPVDGCRWCGTVRREHGPQWSYGVGNHRWTEPTARQLHLRLASAITADVGDQMGELYEALPDLIFDRFDRYQDMGHAERIATVQGVAEVIGGKGYVYAYPVP